MQEQHLFYREKNTHSLTQSLVSVMDSHPTQPHAWDQEPKEEG